ncbi:MAG: epoxyqueuosine reductase QueH [Eubacteriales bacterium]|nr:epoxyqueuosine reductase QueH [Eubacteriales bacterium]
MQNVNYSKETEKIIDRVRGLSPAPRLLLHSCCAPCSSYCLEYLREYFEITVFYYNPNITEDGEYEKRKEEELRLIGAYNRQVEEGRFEEESGREEPGKADPGGEESGAPESGRRFAMHSTTAAKKISVLEAPYDPEAFLAMAKGLEQEPEGGARCMACYALRLARTAQAAAEGGYDYFTTTLTISPLKNAARLNEIGQQMAQKYGAVYLPSDFKKKNGYKRSTELSAVFGLYRQNYCGCVYSKQNRQNR